MDSKTPLMLQLEELFDVPIDTLLLNAMNTAEAKKQHRHSNSFAIACVGLNVAENSLRYLCYRRGIEPHTTTVWMRRNGALEES